MSDRPTPRVGPHRNRVGAPSTSRAHWVPPLVTRAETGGDRTTAATQASTLKSVSKCFVVSLEDDDERRQHMRMLLDQRGVTYEYWPAIRGIDLDEAAIEANGWTTPHFFRGKAARWLRLNQLGCALSHLALATHVARADAAHDAPVLVLEDDVELAADFAARADALVARCPPGTDLLYLGYHDPRRGRTIAPGLRAAYTPRGTLGYVLWPSGARKIAEGLLPLDLPIDEELGRRVRRQKLAAVDADPPLVLHGTLQSRIRTRVAEPGIDTHTETTPRASGPRGTGLRFAFYGFWPSFHESDADVISRQTLLAALFPFLDPAHEVPLRDADLVICSVFAPLEPLRALKADRGDRVRIVQFTGEARISDPQHEVVDFTVGSNREGPRDSVCPLGLLYYQVVRRRLRPIAVPRLHERRFCAMVCRELPLRRAFYDALSAYKPVDGYGQMFGRPAPGRYWDQAYLELLAGYKFVICFENQARAAYHSEKILNPMLAGCIPIYWGSPFIRRLVAADRFVMLPTADDMPRVVERIRELDGNDAQFDAMTRAHPWAEPSWEEVDARYGCRHAVARLTEWLDLR